MRKFLPFVYGVGLIFLLSSLAVAEDKKGDEAIKLGEVVVTATRTEKDVDSTPGSVSVITSKEIQEHRIHALDEAIKYEAGVYARRTKGLADSMPRVQLRGLYGQNRTLVLLDGQPLNEGYTGAVDWNTIATENVERIEVIRGPSSALYGGNAMGGVINIITKTPKKFYANGSYGYGSNATFRYGANVGDYFMDRLGIALGFELEQTGGEPSNLTTSTIKTGVGTLTGGWETSNTSGTRKWVIGDNGDNEARRWNFNLKTKYDLTNTGSLTFNFQRGFHRYSYGRPHTYLRDASGNRAYSGYVDCGGGERAYASPSSYVYYTGIGEKETSNYSLMYKEVFGALTFNGKAGYQYRDSWYTSARPSSTQDYDSAKGILSSSNTSSIFTDLQFSLPVTESHLLTFGVYFRGDNFRSSEYDLSFYQHKHTKTKKNTITKGKDRFYAAYVQDEWRIIDKLSLFTGIRFDYWEAFDGKSGSVGSVENFDEPDDLGISPKVALVFRPIDGTIIKGSVGRAFRAPDIYELYRTWQSSRGTTYHSNPDLDPETLWNYEIGLDQYLFSRRIKLSVTYFHTDIYDMISSYYIGRDSYKDNVGKAKIDGIELGTTLRPFDWLRAWGNLTYNDSRIKKYKRKSGVAGKKITQMPVTTANVGAEVTYRWFMASIAGQYIGKIYKKERNDDVHDVYGGYTQKYWLWDTKLSITPVRNFEVSFSVENLFDRKYFEYYLGNGRTYFVEGTVRW